MEVKFFLSPIWFLSCFNSLSSYKKKFSCPSKSISIPQVLSSLISESNILLSFGKCLWKTVPIVCFK